MMMTYKELIALLSEAEGHLIAKLQGNPDASLERAKNCVTKARKEVRKQTDYFCKILMDRVLNQKEQS